MHRPTPSPSSHERPRASHGRFPRLALLVALIAALIGSITPARSQCVVQNPSFETITTPPVPGYSAAPATMVAMPGVPGWFVGDPITGNGVSPDVFWPPLYVPNNFMTTPAQPRTAFDGNNYAGLSTGRFYGVFGTEILSNRLSASPTGAPYEVRARFSMGARRNQPSFMRMQLVNSTTGNRYVVGYRLVNDAANWQLFSQMINLPATPTYDFLVIDAVDSLPNNWGAYCFVDSVNICRVNPCDYLGASLKMWQDASGKCCFDLYYTNTTPSVLPSPYYVRTTVTLPVQIVSNTNAAGYASVPNFPTQVTWSRAPYGSTPLSTGTSILAGSYCINANGVFPQTHLIEFLDKSGRVMCRYQIVTDCKPTEPVPCLDLNHGTIKCGPIVAGQQTYQMSINATSTGPVFPAGSYVLLTSPQGTISGGLFPGNRWNLSGTNTFINPFTFTDTPPVNNVACIIAEYHIASNGSDKTVCRDTFCIDIPKCPVSCCDNFTKLIQNTKISYSNGVVNLSGCAQAGPGLIKRFSATIVSAQTRSWCHGITGPWTRAFGDITNAALAGSVLPGPYFVTNAPFGREAVWGGPNHYQCVSFNPCVPFKLAMTFPNPPSSFLCRDTLKFCIRYSFTDCNCVTCDTVICYNVVRKKALLPWLGDPDKADPVDGTPIDKANGALMNLSMSSDDDGSLSITLPEFTDDQPAIRITGISYSPLGVALTSMSDERGNGLSISGNVASGDLSLSGGQSVVYSVSYSNSDGERVIGNYVRFRYVFVDDEEQEEHETDDILVEGYTPDYSGGDRVAEESEPPVQSVRTYVLHVEAGNAMGNDVNGVKVTVTGDRTRLIAVGPVGDGTSAVLLPGEDKDGNSVVQIDPSTWEVNKIASGTSLSPIYLTFSNAADGATISYETLNDNGTPITTGEVSLGSPLRTAGVGSDLEADQANMLNPIYPNPSGKSATVSFEIPRESKVSLSIRDLNGREIARQIDARQIEGGNHLVSVKTEDLAQGTYMVVLEVDGRIYTRALKVMR